MMKEIVFDIEVFPKWWCIVYSNPENTEVGVIQSTDKDYISQINTLRFGNCLIGFNIKGYDLRILNLIMDGGDPSDIYGLSLAIINNDESHRYNNFFFWKKFNFTDLFDDWRYGSLKAFESNIGMSIKESSISFDKVDLSLADKKEIIEYCKHDVKATCKLLDARREYVDGKKLVAETFNLPLVQTLKSTVAKIGATLLDATLRKYPEETLFRLPQSVEFYVKENVPDTILSMFKYLDDDDKTAVLFENNITYGKGGIHSTIGEEIISKSDSEYILVNFDVTSYYPMLMMIFDLLSRNVKDKSKYKILYDMSVELKQEYKITKNEKIGKLRKFLKLILSAAYGATKNQYNALYDPYNATSMCYLGQILLTGLANKLYKNGAKIIQTNTDGIMIKIKRNELATARLIVKEWETITRLTMEETGVKIIFQRDVNNYIEVADDGEIKLKGKWSNQAEETFANLNAPITHKAILKYYIDNVPVEETINACNIPLEFCFTTKTGPTYSATYYYYKNEPHLVNKVNRVVATTDSNCGTIRKYQKTLNKKGILEESYDKIAEIPLQCLLMNDEVYIPDTLDRQWYIDFAKNKIKELRYV